MNNTGGCGQDSVGSGCDPVSGSDEYGTEF
jgi:hypothetical protein